MEDSMGCVIVGRIITTEYLTQGTYTFLRWDSKAVKILFHVSY